MNFWSLRAGQETATALVDEQGASLSYGDLAQRVAAAAAHLRSKGERGLGMLSCGNRLDSLVAYLGCLQAGHVPLLLPEDLSSDLLQTLVDRYQPDWLMGGQAHGSTLDGSGIALQWTPQALPMGSGLHPALGLLLSTSGTTGSPKLVKLSYDALQANAQAIAQYLEIGPHERALTTLPPNYSYGMSVINSHLQAGACLVLSSVSAMTREFEDTLRRYEVSSIAGVPYTYQMLHRTGFGKRDLPSLRTLTQAGGRLDDRLTRAFQELASTRGWRFFVMYGQTEAGPRMSYVPPERLAEKIGSIGIAIPGGELQLAPDTCEIVYRGPSVMMGYARDRAELATGDELRGTLHTGDLGRVDSEGYFFVTGRLTRFVKLTGNRIGLDEVEQLLQRELGVPVSVGGRDERMVAWIEGNDDGLLDKAKALIFDRFGLHHSLYRLRLVERLPLLPTGKKDYGALLEQA